ncbi:OLC1v1004842C1 [Oldenlandia corymbosa var. corymbosa]|uniref:OLC1v1004842C1 n=1 Tax=Oldenlandia corymbosa var. corymbosa TaxID=529605 RepID=A0AAV1DG68_OLDCO|nr:OLC1v1004842C1 [Oldenlandia corymbosa var. corymbosa]
MSMGDDGIHKIMPITTDLVCLQTSSQIKFLNPKTTQLATVEWPYDVPLSNCETAFGQTISEIATPQELLVVFDYHTQQFQTIKCPPSPTFFNPTYPSHMNLQVKILDFQGTMCVIDEYQITQNHHCEMWAWDPDTSTWDCIFETHEFPNVNTHVPHGLHFRHDWLYPVFLSHKSSPVGQFILKGYDNRHLLLYSVPTRKITHSSTLLDLETNFIIRACYFWESLTHF